MVTKKQKIEGYDNIRIQVGTKKRLQYFKLNRDLLTYDQAINILLNFWEHKNGN